MGPFVMGHFVMGRFVIGRFVCESEELLHLKVKYFCSTGFLCQKNVCKIALVPPVPVCGLF
jgi:hypothetical protein